MHWMSRVVVALGMLWLGVGCDLSVSGNGVLEPAGGGTVVGSLGNSHRLAVTAIDVGAGGRVTVRDATVIGGSFLADGPPPQSTATRAARPAIFSNSGTIQVTEGWVVLLSLPPFNPRATIDSRNCSEIRGGQIDRVVIANRQNLFVFGTEFNLPLGALPVSGMSVPFFPGEILQGPPLTPLTGLPMPDLEILPFVNVTGTFADGTPIDIDFTLSDDAVVRLATPGDPGCT